MCETTRRLALPATITAYETFVESVLVLSPSKALEMEQRYLNAPPPLDNAAKRAWNAAFAAGRVVTPGGVTHVTGARAELANFRVFADITEGAAQDVAIAILARDLISPLDYHTITQWWLDAGLEIPVDQDAAEVARMRGEVATAKHTTRRRVYRVGAVIFEVIGWITGAWALISIVMDPEKSITTQVFTTGTAAIAAFLLNRIAKQYDDDSR